MPPLNILLLKAKNGAGYGWPDHPGGFLIGNMVESVCKGDSQVSARWARAGLKKKGRALSSGVDLLGQARKPF